MDWLLSEWGRNMWNTFYNLCFIIDGTISRLNYGIFDVFSTLAQTRIFSSDIISDLTKRSYSIISIVMLFVLAYSLLKMIVNPDEAKKGKTSGFSIAKHMIIAIVVIAFTPVIFDFSYGVQSSIIKNNVIGRAILGSNEDVTSNAAGEFVTSVFSASFYLTENPLEEVEEVYYEDMVLAKTTGDIRVFRNMTDYIIADQVEYHNIISLIVSGAVLYVLVTFCFDMGVRVIKLAFLQLIAPIPAVMYALPGKDDTLKKWLKESFSSFFEVVVRSAVLYFVVFIFLIINRKLDSALINYTPIQNATNSVSAFSGYTNPTATYNATIYYISKYFIIFSLLVFMKQAPKLIGDLFGIKSDGKLLSLKDRVKDYKPVARAAIRTGDKIAGAAAGIPVAMHAYKKGVKNGNKDTKMRKFMAGFNGLGNGLRGGISNIGNVYDYEYETQMSYSRSEDKGELGSFLQSSFEHNARKFGFESLYEYQRRDEQMKAELEMSKLRKENQNYDEQKRTLNRGAKAIYGDNEKDNKDALKLSESFDSSSKDYVSKASSKIKRVINFEDEGAKLKDKLDKSNAKKILLESQINMTKEEREQQGIDIRKVEAELKKVELDIKDAEGKYSDYKNVKDNLKNLQGNYNSNYNYSELETLKANINANQDISESEKKVMNSFIGGLQKDIIGEHKSTIMNNVINGVENEDAATASIAQEFYMRLTSKDSQVGRASVKIDKDMLKKIQDGTATPTEILEFKEKFKIDSEGAIAAFRAKIENKESIESSDLKDLGDELTSVISKAQMNQRSVNADAQFKVVNYNELEREMNIKISSKIDELRKQNVSDADIQIELNKIRNDYREKMFVNGLDADTKVERNNDRIKQLEEDLKSFDLAHMNDKQISESWKKRDEISRRNIHKANHK